MRVTFDERGWSVEADGWDASRFADRPGAAWPMSALKSIGSDGTISLTFDENGDLVDETGVPEHCSASEVTAFAAWVLEVTAPKLIEAVEQQAAR